MSERVEQVEQLAKNHDKTAAGYREMAKKPGFEPLLSVMAETEEQTAQALRDYATLRADTRALEQQNAALRAALRWFVGEQIISGPYPESFVCALCEAGGLDTHGDGPHRPPCNVGAAVALLREEANHAGG